jgi:periplasmic protein TonB
MHNEGYLASHKRRPGIMAGVVALHIGGLAAVLLLAPTVVKIIDDGMLIADPIEAPKDPPPIPDTKPKAKSESRIDQPVPRTPPIPRTIGETGLIKETQALDGAGMGGGVGEFEFKPIDPPKDPVMIAPQFSGRNAQPPYPPGLQRLEIEGAVTVRVLVGIDGRPERIEVVRTDHDGFFTATRDWAMRNWRFKPATRDGVPYAEWRMMTVTFRMD